MSEEVLLGLVWMGSSVRQYAIAAAVFLVLLLIFILTQKFIVNHFHNAVVRSVGGIKPRFYWFVAFYIALQFLTLEGTAQKIVDVIIFAWVTYQVVVGLQILIDYLIQSRFIHGDDRSSEVVSNIISAISSILLWTLGIIFVLSNIGINATSLIAGLGIGGLAIALAAQNVLTDLLSSLAIYFDRPFSPGDFIVMGDVSGNVQKVGIKTTRIRSLSGEEIIVPNKDITAARIKNYRRMEKRRVEFDIGVVYTTTPKQLKAIPEIIRKSIEAAEGVRFDRVHLHELSDASVTFVAVYHVPSPKYDQYMNAHQQILLGIKEGFDKAKIVLARPTRTIKMEK